MQMNTEVSHPIAALNLNLAGLPNLLRETRTQIDAKRQSKFDEQAKSLLNDCIKTVRDKAKGLDGGDQGAVGGKGGELNRIAETLRLELKHLSDLLEKSGSRIDSEEKQRLEFQVAKAVDKCIETLREKVEGFNPEGAKRVVQKWRKLNREVEILSRRLELLQPPTKDALIATLWWMSELGQESDLDLLQKIKVGGPFDSKDVRDLIAATERSISKRVFDSDRRLQHFFGVNPEGLTHLLGITGREVGGPVSQRARATAEHLHAILESLTDLFEREETDRWLHSPNEMFDGKTPLEAIAEGQARRVHQLLVRIEEGIPY
jgi:hypothetical protein